MDRRELTRTVKGLAGRVGFDDAGIAALSPIEERRLRNWLRNGFQGEMHYMERGVERRLNPEKILPGMKSMIVVLLDYGADVNRVSDSSRGVVSRYALGRDYHKIMKRKLKRLCQSLQDLEPEARFRFYCDTGPVLDKLWAGRAGLGWIGKHTNLLSRSRGSWFFIGELLTDLELEPDAPESDFCGSCTRCIDACPTDAIVAPYHLDSRRCISYLTIELREDIPEPLRPGMGNLVFGCDICQEVCPWNRKSPRTREPGFEPIERDYSLSRLSRLSPEEFDREFAGSPVRRTKWRGFMRNVAVAMGNSRSDEFVDDLLYLIRIGDVQIARHARWALEKIGTPRAREALTRD